jgi:prephenate dehydrogenase
MGDILLTNRAAVLAQLGRYRETIEALITLLETGNDPELIAWLEKAQAGFEGYKIFMESRT